MNHVTRAFEGTSDTVTSKLFVKPTADAENAITVKSPSATWGVSQAYGKGQAFEVLKDTVAASDIGYSATTPDDFVVMRVVRDGAIGTGGNFHLATGLRQPSGYASSYALQINPYISTTAIQIAPNSGVTQTASYITVASPAGASQFDLTSAGRLKLPIGNTSAGLELGGDVTVTRNAANQITATASVAITAATPIFQIQPASAGNTEARLFSGNAANYALHQIGRTTGEFQLGTAASADLLFTGVAAGDSLVRSVSGKLHIGVASGAAEIRIDDSKIGFYGTAPVVKPTGVAVTAAGVHAALVTLGLIAA